MRPFVQCAGMEFGGPIAISLRYVSSGVTFPLLYWQITTKLLQWPDVHTVKLTKRADQLQSQYQMMVTYAF